MKLYLISAILLLVPLKIVLAESAAKVLYMNDGNNYFVIAEGNSLSHVDYAYYENKLSFLVRSSLKDGWDMLIIKGDYLRRQKLSFAVESFVNEKRNSSEKLKHLIDYSGPEVILRELTKEEQNKLEVFKGREKVKSNFKVIHDKGLLRTEARGIPFFIADAYHYPSSGEYAFDVDALAENDRKQSKIWLLNATIPDKSFVIERLPNRRLGECYLDEVTGLKPIRCFGNIVLRNLTDDD